MIKTVATLLTLASGTLAFQATNAEAGNQRLCSPNLRAHEVVVNFPKGAFTTAGEGGKRADFSTSYNNGDGSSLQYNLFEANGFGGNSAVDYVLCHVDQAKGVGAPSTLIFVWGHVGNCGNWWGFTQVQSAAVYSSCDASKSGNRLNVTLK